MSEGPNAFDVSEARVVDLHILGVRFERVVRLQRERERESARARERERDRETERERQRDRETEI